MNTNIKKRFLTLVITTILIGLMILPVCNSISLNNNKIQILKENEITEYKGTGKNTEFWALLVAGGVYYKHPDKDRPSMGEAVDELYNTLVSSPNWQADHIQVLKGSETTTFNLIKKLIWLIRNEGKGDMSLIYITTHGTPLRNLDGLPMDLPPKDENDGDDEALIMYKGYEKLYDHFTDDMLRFFLRFLNSNGLCLIIDSCFSGGFNDPIGIGESSVMRQSRSEAFTQGFIDDISANGRIILMSSHEEEYSYGSIFTELLIEGFKGWADLLGNNDGINSAEESFDFAYPWVVFFSEGKQHPTYVDDYPGDFPITYN